MPSLYVFFQGYSWSLWVQVDIPWLPGPHGEVPNKGTLASLLAFGAEPTLFPCRCILFLFVSNGSDRQGTLACQGYPWSLSPSMIVPNRAKSDRGDHAKSTLGPCSQKLCSDSQDSCFPGAFLMTWNLIVLYVFTVYLLCIYYV